MHVSHMKRRGIDLIHDQMQRLDKERFYKRIVSDRDTKLILQSTYDTAKSAYQIMFEANIAQSTLYRKLRKLVRMNFLQIEYVIGEHGRWEMRYKNNLCLLHNKT